MKSKINIFLLVLTFYSIMARAQEPVDQHDVLAAQISVTHDAIQQVLTKLKNTETTVENFNHPDYLSKAKVLNEQIEKAVIAFETVMNDDILKNASLWADRISEIQKSSQYSDTQRASLLKDQMEQAKLFFNALSERYQKEIDKLYNLVLPRVEMKYLGFEKRTELSDDLQERLFAFGSWVNRNVCSLKVKYDLTLTTDRETKRYGLSFNRHKAYLKVEPGEEFKTEYNIFESKDNDIIAGKNPNLQFYNFESKYFTDLQKIFYNDQIQPNCFSSSCISLYASQLLAYLSLVQVSLDQPISFKAGNETLTLVPLSLPLNNVIGYFGVPQQQVMNLPFDISADVYRQKLRAQISQVISDPKQDFQNGCSDEYIQLKNLFCHSSEGCLSSSEKEVLYVEIQKSKLSKSSKVKRLAFLQGA